MAYRCKPTLCLFLNDEEIGTDLTALPDGWRLRTWVRGKWTHVDVTADPATAEPQCSCRARGRRPCPHVRALRFVGLLPAAVTV